MHPFFYYHKTNSTFIYNNTLTKRKELPREKVALSMLECLFFGLEPANVAEILTMR